MTCFFFADKRRTPSPFTFHMGNTCSSPVTKKKRKQKKKAAAPAKPESSNSKEQEAQRQHSTATSSTNDRGKLPDHQVAGGRRNEGTQRASASLGSMTMKSQLMQIPKVLLVSPGSEPLPEEKLTQVRGWIDLND